jgi:hypothetical protein
MHPTVSDYIRILKLEHEFYKHLERFEAIRSATAETPTTTYTAQEIDAMMRALGEVRHGLPPRRAESKKSSSTR